jgi:acylphosphatase
VTVARHLWYSGTVQGVGFRWTAQQLAQRHGVAGSVQNLPTGEVELWVEGEDTQVQAFLEALAQRLAGCIDQVRERDASPTGVNGFRIVR